RMNGIAFRSLLRFWVPADSLARAAGGNGAGDLAVNSLQIHLSASFQRGEADLTVDRPLADWDEYTVFSDTLAYTEVEFPSTPIPDASAAPVGEDSSVVVDLPAAFAEEAIAASPLSAPIEVMLRPAGADFLTILMSRNSGLAETDLQRPWLELTYSVGGETYTYRSGAAEDTYWGGREGGGPAPDLLIVGSGIRYSALLRFALPDSIPAGATVNSVRLEMELDEAHSLLDLFSFGVTRIDILAGTSDTTYTSFNTLQFDSLVLQPDFPLDPTLMQSWLAAGAPNNGLALRSQDDTQILWAVFRNPRLRVIYSLPPDIY
ncbi:MAG TPA: hypothetical protein VJ417_01810, partial [Candidatus Glassbacteria bacterium]|nr:hypothetical protein [Candidatus Glassbacteria bacterium]